MRDAETVLTVIRERGSKGLHLEDVYRQLYNPELYLRAYGRIYKNDGAMTEGTTSETVDGMSQRKIADIIEAIRFERWRWTPVRRVEIPKANGKTRPLGLPTWSDKLLQEVMRALLEAYYEPQFSDNSHGFRPNRGCHSALETIEYQWNSVKWFVEGDIKGCFDNIDHSVLLEILGEKIHDNRFLRLVNGLLHAGYMEDWKYRDTLAGTPQGGVISPILSNIYLDKLDRFVFDTLLPRYNKGAIRRKNSEYTKLLVKRRDMRNNGKLREARTVLLQMRQIPVLDPKDPKYRRLRYVRYADDFILGLAGPKAEAEEIKEQIGAFLRDELHLELSPEKTLITHAVTEKARFLGHDIQVQMNDTKIGPHGKRCVNGKPALRIPPSFIEERSKRYMKDGKPVHRAELTQDDDYSIVARYQQEYRGYVQFYSRTVNLAHMNKLLRVMEISLLKTLACKHKSTVMKMVRKHKGTVLTEHGPRRCLRATVVRNGKPPLTAVFGGIPLRRNKKAVIKEPTGILIAPRTELVKRLLADKCEACGSTENVEVHHVRKLADLKVQGRKEKPLWMRVMSARRRKTMVLCSECHDNVHAGRPLKTKNGSE